MRLLILLGLVGLVACTSSPSTTNKTCEQTVTIAGFAFSPNAVTIKKGGCVSFKNTDASTHSVHVDNGTGIGEEVVGNLGLASSGDTKALNETLNYICGFHPNMKGKIEVQ